uniref:Cilia- and flagella-associated protein 206 n=2 Tax=Echinococcus granulosus TaxID=6210 RepID=A0A068WWV2_ECHGR|nr:NUDIX hydrolase domain [Echinococcus granulosus]
MCVDRITERNSPTLDTIRMQVFFDMNYMSRDLFLKEHEGVVATRFKPILEKICAPVRNSPEEYEKVYRFIIFGTLLYPGLGLSNRITAIREATSILQTYLPIDETPKFCFMHPQRREQKFFELVELVLGTRVYNFSLGFGGEGIDNLPELAEEGVRTTVETLDKQLKEVETYASLFTSLYLKLAAVDVNTETQANVSAIEAEKMGISRSLLKAATINARQLAVYLRLIRRDLVSLESGHREDKEKLVLVLGEILNCLRANQNTLHPSFQKHLLELSRLWMKFKENVTFIAMLSNLLNSLQQFSFRRYVLLEASRLLNLIHEAEVVCDEMRKKATTRVKPKKEDGSQWAFPTPGSEVKVDLNGFCAWSIVRYQGLPIPCTPWIGVYAFEGKKYGFSSVEAAVEFGSAPEKFIAELNEVARNNPELIDLLSMASTFQEGSAFFPNEEDAVEPKQLTDQGSQTVVHPIPRHIDTKYTWNEWELRRRALQMTYVRKCVTHSVQTHLSNWRRDNDTQVYLPRLKCNQTKRDNYSQVPRPSVYLHGLRGGVSVAKAEGAKEAFEGSPYSNWCKVYRFVDSTKVDLTLPAEDHFCGMNSETRAPIISFACVWMPGVAELFGSVNRQRCISLLQRLTPVRPRPDGAFDSAVLIPLCYYDGHHPAILFTKRSLLVRHFPGVMSFPGGRVEPSESVVEAALRELEEEVGIPPSFVDSWTTFAPFPTRTTPSLIHPLVGFIGNYDPLEDTISQRVGGSLRCARLRPSPREVEMVVFRSINWLLNPACRKYCVYRERSCLPFTGATSFLGSPCSTSRKPHKNVTFSLPVFGGSPGSVELPRITGATALLTHQLLTCLSPKGLP